MRVKPEGFKFYLRDVVASEPRRNPCERIEGGRSRRHPAKNSNQAMRQSPATSCPLPAEQSAYTGSSFEILYMGRPHLLKPIP